jgi:uncharacterized protein (DUF983 family)
MDDFARRGGEGPVGGPQHPDPPVSARTALIRGLMKRCPHCGIGPIYTGWAHDARVCSHCGLVYEPTEGDTWAFTIIGDRIPVAAGIVIVYFELGSRLGPLALFAAMTVVIALLLWTTPNRWGLGVALLYLQRTRWPDPLDKLPPAS